jgi:hypothetical protein
MRLILAITVTSLALAGCVGDYDKSADANLCERSMPAGQAVASQLFPPGALNIPTRSFLGSGKLDLDDTTAYACIDPKSKTNTVPNLHKIRLDHISAI